MGLINFIKSRFGGGGNDADAAATTATATAIAPATVTKAAAPAPRMDGNSNSNGNGGAYHGDEEAADESEAGKIFFGSQTGTARRLAHKLAASLKTRHGLAFEVHDLKDYEPENLNKESVALFILSTYEGADGWTPPESAAWFCQWSRESAQDERVGMLHLRDVKYAVFGCGNREYGADRFNAAARALDADLARLGGMRLLRRADGDESSGRMEEQFHEWADKLAKYLKPATAGGADEKLAVKGGGNKAVGKKVAIAATAEAEAEAEA
eukprot:CAMPEP_0197583256 /NCGR_PEP_ID=MMETSP1326-20131121/6232_1 /TAXON_ID=1155430 /ORGANISM="Genus nov. species nov., Strain RCC2288" /LENGTH=267 /DNA_ID=CAMNT_0043147449 /DNA_START=219 /DNA_END=1018 /DNA_ORIENTATION=-